MNKGKVETEDKREEDKTVKEVFDSLNEDQKNLLYLLVGKALMESGEHSDYEGETELSGAFVN